MHPSLGEDAGFNGGCGLERQNRGGDKGTSNDELLHEASLTNSLFRFLQLI